MNSLTGAQVWDASLADPSFSSQMPEGSPVREAIKPFIEAAPKALEELLDQPLTLQVLGDAKIAFLRYCLGNGFVEKVGGAAGAGGSLVKAMLEGVVETLAAMRMDLPAFLKEHGVKEEEVMLSSEVGLNGANQDDYKAGKLTVADVLRTQPGVILKNSD